MHWEASTASAATNSSVPELIAQLGGGLGDEAAAKACLALVEIGDPAVPQLAAAFADERRIVRWLAVQTLGRIRSPSVLPPLMQALRDQDPSVRRYAASYLGLRGGTNVQVRTALHRALADDHIEVARQATISLSQLGDVSWKTTLIEQLNAGFTDGKAYMARKLLIMTGDAAVPQLAAALADKRENVRWSAVHVLGSIRTPATLQPLLDAASDTDANVRQHAVLALGRHGSATVPVLTVLYGALSDADGQIAWSAKKSLDSLGDIACKNLDAYKKLDASGEPPSALFAVRPGKDILAHWLRLCHPCPRKSAADQEFFDVDLDVVTNLVVRGKGVPDEAGVENLTELLSTQLPGEHLQDHLGTRDLGDQVGHR